eukprot:scaffold78804_cov20-Tisochrysis_lutea.AAC.1
MLECGCTCTAAVIQGSCVYLADVGDSAGQTVLLLLLFAHQNKNSVPLPPAAVLGYKDELQKCRGETVTVKHNGRNQIEAARIRSDHADMTRLLE